MGDSCVCIGDFLPFAFSPAPSPPFPRQPMPARTRSSSSATSTSRQIPRPTTLSASSAAFALKARSKATSWSSSAACTSTAKPATTWSTFSATSRPRTTPRSAATWSPSSARFTWGERVRHKDVVAMFGIPARARFRHRRPGSRHLLAVLIFSLRARCWLIALGSSSLIVHEVQASRRRRYLVHYPGPPPQ